MECSPLAGKGAKWFSTPGGNTSRTLSRNGLWLQPNAVNREIMPGAQKHPENYKNLIAAQLRLPVRGSYSCSQ